MKKDNDIDKNEISPRMRKVLERGRAQARKDVIERGIAQFSSRSRDNAATLRTLRKPRSSSGHDAARMG